MWSKQKFSLGSLRHFVSFVRFLMDRCSVYFHLLFFFMDKDYCDIYFHLLNYQKQTQYQTFTLKSENLRDKSMIIVLLFLQKYRIETKEMRMCYLWPAHWNWPRRFCLWPCKQHPYLKLLPPQADKMPLLEVEQILKRVLLKSLDECGWVLCFTVTIHKHCVQLLKHPN